MTQLTPLQELINYMEENFHLTDESREKFKLALEKEREQIENAFVAGSERGTGNIPFNCEQYYTQNYESKRTNKTTGKARP